MDPSPIIKDPEGQIDFLLTIDSESTIKIRNHTFYGIKQYLFCCEIMRFKNVFCKTY